MSTTRAVLIMDDDEDVRFLVEAMFGKIGFRVDAAVDGKKAIEMYRAAYEAGTPYLAGILDLNIPGGMGGVEVAAQILAFDPRAKLFVSSGNDADPVMMAFDRYGFSGRLPKPFLYADAVALSEQIT